MKKEQRVTEPANWREDLRPTAGFRIEEFGLLIAAERSFAEWDNEEDGVYDSV